MKKLYYIIMSMSLPVIISAQTITQSDLPNVGDAFTMGNDSTYTGAIPAGGMSQTWNYSGLQNNYTDTTGFISPVGTPFASSFPSANLASPDMSTGDYTYFTSNSSGLFLNGIGSSSGNEILSPSPGVLYFPVPFSFGSSATNSAHFQIDTVITDSTGTYNVRIVLRFNSQFQGDGTGTLTTPTGVYPNVLRIKDTEITYDSIYVDIGGGIYVPFSATAKQATHYRFVTSGTAENYLMGIEADSLGTTATSAAYFISNIALSVPTVNANKMISVYPNPVSGILNFKNINQNPTIIIFDNDGREVSNFTGIENKKLDTSTLKNGEYHYEVITGNKIEKGSFVVQH